VTALPGFGGHLIGHSFLASHADGFSTDLIETPSQCARVLRSIATSQLGPASAPRAILESAVIPLLTSLGFDEFRGIELLHTGLTVTARARGRPVAVLVTPWGDCLDGYWRSAVTAAIDRRAQWCLLFNGNELLIVDSGRLYSRRGASFNLGLAADHAATMTGLWCLANAGALCGDPTDPHSLHAIVAASDGHSAGVCRSLRHGVLAASADIASALVAHERAARTLPVEASFEQALTIVYRILFLLFAEARALVPIWHPVYRESYSIESLREIAERSLRPPGLWDALRAIARLAHSGCRAGDLRVPAFNGRLFSPARTPLAEQRHLDDEAARRAVLALATRTATDRTARERIVYRDLGVEQLGAVYEALLDYQPHMTRAPAVHGGRPRLTLTLEPGSGLRKATGTFYTPQPIAEYLVRRTLGPLVRDATPDEVLRLRVLDPAMGSGAFLVAACRYLAAAYERALIAAGDRHPSDIDDSDRAAMRRLIAERCVYGVDLNPMAVQLARLSLWLATLAADRPLSFLDHRLTVGDSLLGVWLSNLRRPPVRRRTADSAATLPLFADDRATDALLQALPVRFSLEATPNDTLEQVRAKEYAFAGIAAAGSGLWQWKRISDFWSATWFAENRSMAPASAFAALADDVLSGSTTLPVKTATAYFEHSERVARARRFFHWELEFPEVFFDRDGRRLSRPGFDAVIGNPPWDMLRADAGVGEFSAEARRAVAATVRFTRDAGVYTAQSTGHANRYQLFLERTIQLTRRGGRFGLVLPAGLASDHGCSALRRLLMTRCNVDALAGLDNHRGIFPIHRSVRFLLITATAGSPTERIACRFDLDSPADLEALGDEGTDFSEFGVKVSPALLERLSGPSLAVPHLRAPIDLIICEKAAALFPPLGSQLGWRAHFGRELNATEDRPAFRTTATGRGLPVIDGRHLAPFHVALDRSGRTISEAEARRRLGIGRIDRARLAYRDVAGATNRLTLIAAVLPAHCVSTHTVFCLRTPMSLWNQQLLCGLLNSLVVNYLARMRVTTHVTTAIVEQLPLPTPDAAPSACRQIAAAAARLARRADPGALAALNARAAELYQLTREEFAHVLGTFPLVAQAERDAAFAAFL
jgi:hypothetical protein